MSISSHRLEKKLNFLLPSSVFSIAFFTVKVGTGSHPAMPHGAVCFDVAADTIRADDIGIALDFPRGLILGCKYDMRNCKFLSIRFVSPTLSERVESVFSFCVPRFEVTHTRDEPAQ